MMPLHYRNSLHVMDYSILTEPATHAFQAPLNNWQTNPNNIPRPKYGAKRSQCVCQPKNPQNRLPIWITWFLSHSLYWAHLFQLLPSGAGLPFKQPVWDYKLRKKSETRDYIIEPDWNSNFK